MRDDLKEILLSILARQHKASETLALVAADVQTLILMFSTIHPEAHELLQKALLANRRKFAEDVARNQAEIQLLQATVSKMVQ